MTKVNMTITISAVLRDGVTVEDFIQNLNVVSDNAWIDIIDSDVNSLENK